MSAGWTLSFGGMGIEDGIGMRIFMMRKSGCPSVLLFDNMHGIHAILPSDKQIINRRATGFATGFHIADHQCGYVLLIKQTRKVSQIGQWPPLDFYKVIIRAQFSRPAFQSLPPRLFHLYFLLSRKQVNSAGSAFFYLRPVFIIAFRAIFQIRVNHFSSIPC
jgi:hypothetical protein